MCLSFGLKSARKLFNNYAEALLYMAIKNGANHLTDHFLEATQADYDKSIDCLATTTEDADVERQLNKCASAAQEIEALDLLNSRIPHKTSL